MNDFDNIYIEAKVCRNHFKNQSITTNNKFCHSCAKKFAIKKLSNFSRVARRKNEHCVCLVVFFMLNFMVL